MAAPGRLGFSDPDVHPLRSVREEGWQRLDRVRAVGQPHVRPALGYRLGCGAQLGPCELVADAEMDAVAEGHMLGDGAPLETQLLRRIIGGRTAPAGPPAQHDRGARRYRD